MSETTKKCEVKMSDGKPCGRELYDGKCCIFHSEKEDKDPELFQKKLDEIFKDESLKTYDFTGFIFPASIVFPKEFSKNVSFKRAKLKGGAHFEYTWFKGEADFERATFKRGAFFVGSTFKGRADFGFCMFEGDANFLQAIFLDEACFWTTGFRGNVYFGSTDFKAKADFGFAMFRGSAIFERTAFKDNSTFSFATFNDRLLISAKEAFKGEVDLRSVKFSKPEKVEFQKLDFSKFRFLETDLRGVQFTDVGWYRDKDKGRNKAFDEVSPDPYFKEFDYALISQLYRRLRANYEENLRYGEAGDFYIGEMEMTRKAQTSIFKKLPLLFYKAISNYGESYYRPLGWIAIILLIFPLLFMFAGIQPVSLDPNNPMQDVIRYKLDFSSAASFLPTTEKIGDYYTSFLYSMSVFSFIRDKKYTTIDNWGHTLFVLESILSPVTLAFFLLALRRRFKR